MRFFELKYLYQLIVVSDETLRGGMKVNEVRQSNGLSPLQIHCVQLLEDLVPTHVRDMGVEDWKISSSSARMRLLGSLLKEPEVKCLKNFISSMG
jgi:phosphopantetheine adenylyltransferase / dephospho-CoA kinase